jgi:hypothetical protein
VVAILVADAQLSPGLLGRRHHARDLGGVAADRLLGQHMRARRQRALA